MSPENHSIEAGHCQERKDESLASFLVTHCDRQLPQLPIEIIRNILELLPTPRYEHDEVTNWLPHKVLGEPMHLKRHISVGHSRPDFTGIQGLGTMGVAVSVRINNDVDMESILDKLSPLMQFPSSWKTLDIVLSGRQHGQRLGQVLRLCGPSLPYLKELRIDGANCWDIVSPERAMEGLSGTSGKSLKVVTLHSDLLLCTHVVGLFGSVLSLTLHGNTILKALYVLSELPNLHYLSLLFKASPEDQETSSFQPVSLRSLRSLRISCTNISNRYQMAAFISSFTRCNIEHVDFKVQEVAEDSVFEDLDSTFPYLKQVKISVFTTYDRAKEYKVSPK